MPYMEIAVALVFVVAFAKGGEMEARTGGNNHGLLWAALSLAVTALVVAVLELGAGWLIVAQLGLFVAIGAVRAAISD
jgi:hypothetical protein